MSRRRILMWAFSPLCLLALASYAPAGDPKPGDIVKPGRPRLSITKPQGLVEQSLYEYVPGGHRTTGKRIRFRLPPVMVLPDATPGPRMRLSIKISMTDGTSPDEQDIRVRIYSADVGGNIGARNIGEFNHAFGVFGFPVKDGLVLDPQSCDVDRYSATEFSSSQRSLLVAADMPADGPPAPDTFVVGYPKGAEAYEAVGGCFEWSGNCALQSSYRGWPTYISFKKTDACGVIKILTRVRASLDRYFVDETPRGLAYADTRWTPVTDRWRD
jgi:hypothetical protein